MKKRKKVITLLDRMLRQDESHVKVVIKGCETGLTLYEGSYLHVPYLLCSDYVKSYKHVSGYLEIVSTAQSYEESI